MKYLVLGSKGQVGEPLCKYLKKAGEDVLTFDIEANAQEDLRIPNNQILDSYIKESDFIFFLAWDVGGSKYLIKYQDTFDFIQNNIKITSNTFELIKKYNKPFIFASSQMANMGFSSYGVTKNIGERLTHSLNGITVKFWNVYGPEHNQEKFHAISDFIIKAKKTKIIDMLTDGKEVRQFLHSEDCARCLHILSKEYLLLPRDKEYHLTSFQWTSILEIATIVANFIPETTVIPSRAFDAIQLGTKNEPDPFILNYWQPKITLEEGIKNIIRIME
jgi:nucleoside-diphosphate-sugar epimerase